MMVIEDMTDDEKWRYLAWLDAERDQIEKELHLPRRVVEISRWLICIGIAGAVLLLFAKFFSY